MLEQRYRQRFIDGHRDPVHFDLDPERVAGFPTLFGLDSYRLNLSGPVVEIDTTIADCVSLRSIVERIRSVVE